jgi:hypothetical protein
MLVSISAYTYLPQNAPFPAGSAVEPIIGTTTDVRFCHLSQRLAHAVAWAWLACWVLACLAESAIESQFHRRYMKDYFIESVSQLKVGIFVFSNEGQWFLRKN